MTFEAVCLQSETNNNVLVHRFFYLRIQSA